ncbi:hypothetical protein K438DRAFT_1598523 [Mycena galopus ATCC 62051]|nr:hypothetical protein K438DRAFT_1598523 [Mycena galopus ATCC 62051]
MTIISCHPATYYDPDGGMGACGSTVQNYDFIVALGVDNWDDGSHCRQTVIVVVQDLCDDCEGDNEIALSEGAMAALDSNYIDDGAISVLWSFAY